MRTRERTERIAPSRALLLAVALIAALGCVGCGSPFVKASDTFATAAKTGVDAITPAFATASRLCRTRARLDFMFHREKGLAKDLWSKWYTDHNVGDRAGNTWKAQCDKLASSDAMLAKGLAAIGAYAEVLKTAAASGNYDGKSLETVVKDSTALSAALTGDATDSNTFTGKVAGLSGPIAFIGKFAVQAYAADQLEKAVRTGSPAVDEILTALKAYNDALKNSIDDADSQLADVLDQADKSIRDDDEAAKRPKPDPMRLFALHDTALRYEKELADLRSTWEAYGKVIVALSEANKAMAEAAAGKMKHEEALKLVLGFANEVMTQLATVKQVTTAGKE
jgi:hypothetical protein